MQVSEGMRGMFGSYWGTNSEIYLGLRTFSVLWTSRINREPKSQELTTDVI